jgi:hypothetical protein
MSSSNESVAAVAKRVTRVDPRRLVLGSGYYEVNNQFRSEAEQEPPLFRRYLGCSWPWRYSSPAVSVAAARAPPRSMTAGYQTRCTAVSTPHGSSPRAWPRRAGRSPCRLTWTSTATAELFGSKSRSHPAIVRSMIRFARRANASSGRSAAAADGTKQVRLRINFDLDVKR